MRVAAAVPNALGGAVPAFLRGVGPARADTTAPSPASADVDLQLLARARSRAPLRLALSRISARLVATRAWERLGFARLADYARERTGQSARQLQDLAHTSVRLGALPEVEAALASGRLGWSQARLVARVATPEDEGRWITFARCVRVRELEHAVRAVDRGSLEGGGLETDEDGNDGTFKVGVVVRCTPRVRSKFQFARGLARRVSGEALPIWACMEAVTAEALSALPVGAAMEGDEPECASVAEGGASWAERTRRESQGVGERHPSAPSAGFPCAPSHRLHPIDSEPAPEAANVCAAYGDDCVASLLADFEGVDAFELDARLRRAIALEQQLDAELAPFLARIARSRAYRRRGFTSLEGYAREHLGLSPRTARALLRIERAAATCPALRSAFASRRLSWVQVQAILPILLLGASRHSRTRWIDWSTQVSVRRLEADVDHALDLYASDPTASIDPPSSPDDRQSCAQNRDAGVDMSIGAELETAHFFFAAPPEAARVFERDGWRCTVPGCSSYRNLHDHHVVFRAAGGSNELGNRTTLCAWHHLRGVHAARVRCSGTAPDGLSFELGLRAGQAPLLCFAPGERLVDA